MLEMLSEARKMVQELSSRGVHKIYPWQAAALECGADGSNLVYSAPTSGGKSLVADILLIRRLMGPRTGKRVSVSQLLSEGVLDLTVRPVH